MTAIERVTEKVEACSEGFQVFFASLAEFLSVRREGHPVGPYGQQERILGSTRTLTVWSDLEVVWDNLRQPYADLVDVLARLESDMVDLAERGIGRAEDLALATRAAGHELGAVFDNLDRMVFDPDPMTIYWVDVRALNPRPSLHAAPLEVGPLVEKYLWHAKEAVIMTSATLTAAGEFDYIRHRLNADEADELAVGSPFDYETSTLLYLINDIPEPNAGPAYQRAVEEGLIRICTATRGRRWRCSPRTPSSGALPKPSPARWPPPACRSLSKAKAPHATPCWSPFERPIRPCCWARVPSGRASMSQARPCRCWPSSGCLSTYPAIRLWRRDQRPTNYPSTSTRSPKPSCASGRVSAG